MKSYNWIFRLCLMIIIFNISTTQKLLTEESEIEANLRKFKKTLKEKANNIKSKMLKQESYLNDFQKTINADFAVDTFMIVEVYKYKLFDVGSSSYIASINYETTSEWDELLNKYYKILMNLLIEDSKKLLKNSQKKWLEYRDSEKEFNNNLFWDSDQGTLQYVWISDRTLEITKSRVIEIVDYILRDGVYNESE